ncbi:MAG TPA: hypothetical protein VGS11_08590 [Candidatus Bathyarchaeia archaeon]|nr:hypothetical protein [Candidatus Bathyarchaeia archaeon]
MRKNVLVAGGALLALALVYGASYPSSLLFGLPVAALNIILGLFTKASRGLETQPESAGIKLLIDRGVVRASIYQFVFLDSKLVLKRLSSVGVTVILALVLAVVGLEILFIVGALMGGITGFSLQEFLTQRMRNKISRENELTIVGKDDIKIEYDDLSEVRLIKSRLFLRTENALLVASFPRGYSSRLKPVLADIFRLKFESEESLGAAEASKKEDEKGQHPRSDSGKLPRG